MSEESQRNRRQWIKKRLFQEAQLQNSQQQSRSQSQQQYQADLKQRRQDLVRSLRQQLILEQTQQEQQNSQNQEIQPFGEPCIKPENSTCLDAVPEEWELMILLDEILQEQFQPGFQQDSSEEQQLQDYAEFEEQQMMMELMEMEAAIEQQDNSNK